jgi:diketogulonate reductase-like aldo/keto reductase
LSIARQSVRATATMSELPCFHGPDIRNLPVMAYSPLGGDNNLVVGDRTLAQVGTIHGCSATAVALAWVILSGSVIAIPESGSPAHVKENVVALSIALTPRDLQTLDAAFPGPFGAT